VPCRRCYGGYERGGRPAALSRLVRSRQGIGRFLLVKLLPVCQPSRFRSRPHEQGTRLDRR
jgi:hypothetical protein